MRVLLAGIVAVVALAVLSVLGLGYLVTGWSEADETTRTRTAQRQLTGRLPTAVGGEVRAARPVVAGPRVAEAARGPARRPVAARESNSRGVGDRPVASAVAVGDALAVMRIPRFGPGWRWVALEGTADGVIARGPGHYRLTPLPGEAGNVAFAAHRAGHGDPFIDFDRLRPGDRVVMSQRGARWVYRLDMRPRVVPISASWVLNPLPGHRLTLTTCWPKYGSAKRMFVRGHLVRTVTR